MAEPAFDWRGGASTRTCLDLAGPGGVGPVPVAPGYRRAPARSTSNVPSLASAPRHRAAGPRPAPPDRPVTGGGAGGDLGPRRPCPLRGGGHRAGRRLPPAGRPLPVPVELAHPSVHRPAGSGSPGATAAARGPGASGPGLASAVTGPSRIDAPPRDRTGATPRRCTSRGPWRRAARGRAVLAGAATAHRCATARRPRGALTRHASRLEGTGSALGDRRCARSRARAGRSPRSPDATAQPARRALCAVQPDARRAGPRPPAPR
jgi:hypothetical protein